MLHDDSGSTTIEPGDDFSECAKVMAAEGYEEFAFFPYIDAAVVESAARGRFMPMGLSFEIPGGRRDIFLPKLHVERCLLDPAVVRITKTARRESRNYSLGFNRAFDTVLDSCVAAHGSGWLVPNLVDAFKSLHGERSKRSVAFISVELWRGNGEGTELVAGEIGYLIGKAYASLTGYTNVSGAGTVQLAALGRALALSGIRVWDLGMELDYKVALGARVLPRARFMPILARAYEDTVACNGHDLSSESRVRIARELVDSGRAVRV